MHDITMPEECSSDCFDSIAYALLKYYNCDYMAYNIKYFYTDYFDPVNNCIIRGISNNDTLKRIYNIDLVINNRDGVFDLSKRIEERIKKEPIGIFIDSYYCHWSPFYHDTYFSHCLLIVDVDYQNKKYLCFDVHFNKKGYVDIDMDILLAHFTSCFTFDFENKKEVELVSLIDKMKDTVNAYKDNITDNTLSMFNYFTKNDKSCLFPANLETSVPLVNIKWIIEDKKHFANALKYIEKRVGASIFNPVIELLSDSDKMFSILFSLLIKYAMVGVLKEDKLKEIINQIYVNDDLINKHIKSVIKELNFR